MACATSKKQNPSQPDLQGWEGFFISCIGSPIAMGRIQNPLAAEQPLGASPQIENDRS